MVARCFNAVRLVISSHLLLDCTYQWVGRAFWIYEKNHVLSLRESDPRSTQANVMLFCVCGGCYRYQRHATQASEARSIIAVTFMSDCSTVTLSTRARELRSGRYCLRISGGQNGGRIQIQMSFIKTEAHDINTKYQYMSRRLLIRVANSSRCRRSHNKRYLKFTTTNSNNT